VPTAFRAKYRLGGTPQTLLIGKTGRVEKVWTGAYLGATKAEIEKTFSVTIPEIAIKPVTGKQ
jgi:hypothetical protein